MTTPTAPKPPRRYNLRALRRAVQLRRAGLLVRGGSLSAADADRPGRDLPLPGLPARAGGRRRSLIARTFAQMRATSTRCCAATAATASTP